MASNENNRRSRARRWGGFLFFIVVLTGLSVLSFFIYQNSITDYTTTPPDATSTPPISTSTIGIATTTIPIISTAPTSTGSKPIVVPPPVSNPTTTSVVAPIIFPQSPLGKDFGMSVGETLLGLSSADLNARLNDMASLGLGWIRFDIQWDYVQPNNATTYNWAALDRVVAAAKAHHIQILAILDYTPQWARVSGCPSGTDKCLPANPLLFANFAKAVVTRYSPQGISDWEIWNEPNLRKTVQPGNSAAAYEKLLQESYIAIKTVDPDATVMIGGLSPAATENGDIAPIDFLTQLYADGAEPYFDALAFHPYTYPTMPSNFHPWNGWSQMAQTNPSLRSVMTANGDDNKKIWITEYGAPTGGPGALESSNEDTSFAGSPDHVTETLQAQMISDAITSIERVTWAGPLFIYSYKDIGTSQSTVENFFGVIRNNGGDKPAYQAIKNLLVP